MTYNNGQVMKDLKGYLDYTQIDKAMNYIKIKPCSRKERNWLFFLMLSRTGRRVTEVLRLNISHIDFDKKEIVWNILKKKAPLMRVKAIDDTTFQYLKDYCEKNMDYINRSEGRLFPFKRDWARKLVYRYITESGIRMFGTDGNSIKPHPHHFRHSFAINYLKNVNRPEALRLLQQELEHTKIDVTSQYLQFSLEDQKRIKNELFKEDKKDGITQETGRLDNEHGEGESQENSTEEELLGTDT
jgi:integrase